MDFTLPAIGRVHSCFKEKYGIPRQPGLVPDARASIELLKPYNRAEALRGLEGFSHLWVIFVFHQAISEQWKPTVRPPRLGGNERVGVFASRAPYRPNPIGLSAVELLGIREEQGRLTIDIRGVDLLDGTPVLDIKPYVPYADAHPDAVGGFAPEAPATDLAVSFSEQAAAFCKALPEGEYLQTLIRQVLSNDVRPAYYQQQAKKTDFGFRLLDYEIKWRREPDGVRVVNIERSAGV